MKLPVLNPVSFIWALRICREGDVRLDTDFGFFRTGAERLETLDANDEVLRAEPVGK
jgi:hypothetical protein